MIDEEGKMVGEYTLEAALKMAEDRGLDLIEIAPNAKPPTCKIMDYGKWKYEAKKKAQASKKKQSTVEVKEVQVRPRTDEHDLEVKLKHARSFLLDGDKVKVNLRFHGREMAHQELGLKLLQRISGELDDIGVVEVAPKMEGRQMFTLLAPDQTKIKAYKKAKKSSESPSKSSGEDQKESSSSESQAQ